MKATIEVYEFTELTGKAKEKAAAWLREGNQQFNWWEDEFDYWKEKLSALGWNDIEIAFSGFCCQGDGASFTGTLDIVDYIKKAKMGRKYLALLKAVYAGSIEPSIALKRTRAYHYVHEHSVNLLYEDALGWGLTPKASAQFDDLVAMLKDEIVDQCREIYRDLRDVSEGQDSDESIAEIAFINEYRFDKYGDPVHHLITNWPVAEVAACPA